MIDTSSLTWREVAKFAEETIATAQERLGTPLIPEREADLLRGEIRACKALQELPTPPEDFSTEPLDDYR